MHAHRHLHDFLLLLNTPPDLRHGSLPDSLVHDAFIDHFTAPFGYHLQLLLDGDLRNVNVLLHHPRINFWNLPNDLVVVVFGHLHCDGFLVDVRNIDNPFLDIHPHPLKEPFHLLRQDDVFFPPCRPARDDDVTTPGSKVINPGEERVSEVPRLMEIELVVVVPVKGPEQVDDALPPHGRQTLPTEELVDKRVNLTVMPVQHPIPLPVLVAFIEDSTHVRIER